MENEALNEERTEETHGQAQDDELRFDPERREKAEAYARINRRWMFVELGLSFALIIGFWASGLSQALKSFWIEAGMDAPAALVAGYVGTLMIGSELVTLPLSWWRGFVLPHRFGLSTQELGAWAIDQLKMLGLELLLGLPIAEVIYWLLRSAPTTWWLWAAAFMILVGVVLSGLAPVLIVPLFYDLTPLEDEELTQRIKKLGKQAHTRIVGVYTIDLSRRTTAANAMVMGLGATKRIALGDTLYEEFTPDEIETIVAHELGHQVHHDLELGILVESALTLGGMYAAHRALLWGIARFGFTGLGDVAAMPWLMLVATVFSLATMPLINAYSRWRERLADDFAVRTTGKPQAFTNALTRLGDQNLAEAEPPQWEVSLFYSHPPLATRIERITRRQKASQQTSA
jgi:STE24 endopeptidase